MNRHEKAAAATEARALVNESNALLETYDRAKVAGDQATADRALDAAERLSNRAAQIVDATSR